MKNKENNKHAARLMAVAILLAATATAGKAQVRTVENRPYTDLRIFHYGVLVGLHMQDLELTNVGPTTVNYADGTSRDVMVSTDQNKWDAGFTVGVLGELRLNTNFQLRIAPAMLFGTRNIVFRNYSERDANGQPAEQRQTMKTAYVSAAMELIMAPERTNNHRPYFLVGLNPMLNLTPKDDDYIKLKRGDCFLEAGIGCDFYLPYFKLRPELKFMYGLTNSLDKGHKDHLRNESMLPYAQSVSKARSKIIALTFYFE